MAAESSEPHRARGALLRPRLLCGVELPVALFDAASPLVSGNGGADMVWTSPLACSGDLLLRLAACQGKDLIAEARRAALAASRFRGRSAPARAGVGPCPRWWPISARKDPCGVSRTVPLSRRDRQFESGFLRQRVILRTRLPLLAHHGTTVFDAEPGLRRSRGSARRCRARLADRPSRF
jgi:hypothetical protein